MVVEASESTADRASVHRALGDERRLRVVDCLVASDRTPGELAELTGMSSNLLAFHLRILEGVGVVARHRSEGDSRRRYVRLRWESLAVTEFAAGVRRVERVLFVCTHNSARSQFAEALWLARGGSEVWSAGTEPAARVHPLAIVAARPYGVDLAAQEPKGYDAIPTSVDLVVSVCDRAFEGGAPFAAPTMHWSVPDPAHRDVAAFEEAFADIAARVDRLRTRIKPVAA